MDLSESTYCFWLSFWYWITACTCHFTFFPKKSAFNCYEWLKASTKGHDLTVQWWMEVEREWTVKVLHNVYWTGLEEMLYSQFNWKFMVEGKTFQIINTISARRLHRGFEFILIYWVIWQLQTHPFPSQCLTNSSLSFPSSLAINCRSNCVCMDFTDLPELFIITAVLFNGFQ